MKDLWPILPHTKMLQHCYTVTWYCMWSIGGSFLNACFNAADDMCIGFSQN